MANQEWQVGVSTDDCKVYAGDASYPPWDSIDLTYAYFRCGIYGGERYGGGARFTNIAIPQGSTISSAYFKGYTDATYGDRVGSQVSKIEGEDVDSATTFSTLANYNGRTRTTANVTWIWNSPGTGQWVTSDDIKTIIKEIVDRGGWSSGNDLVLFVETTESSTGFDDLFESYDGNSSFAPKLEITWTVVGGISIPVAMHHYNRINKIIRG